MNRPLALLSLLACLGAACPAAAQSRLPPGVDGGPASGGMATRSVSKFLGLERALQDALERRDRSAVLQLLADDFEVRSAASPDSMAADDWLRRELAPGRRDRIVRDLAAREFDDLAIVSFLLDPAKGHARAGAGSTLFVIDVWRQSSGKLLMRYAEQPAAVAPRPSRPSGRE